MLIGKRKFDIRAFCLIASVKPALVLRYEEFYLRRSCEVFSASKLGDRGVHLTNVCVQKHDRRFGEDNIWSKAQLAALLSQRGDGALLEGNIIPSMELAMRACFESVSSHLSTTNGCFQLLGFDYMLEHSGSVQLLEVNRNPDLEPHTRKLYTLITKLVDSTLGVVTEVNLQKARGEALWPVQCEHAFIPIVGGHSQQAEAAATATETSQSN